MVASHAAEAAAREDTFATTVPLLQERALPVRFTGSGSEYFRIWIVNLLLTLVTLGVYYPFAKARRLRYFHANTQVDGHALGFHGDPRKMLRGYFVVGLLLGVYSAAERLSPLAALVAALALAALWPALLRASLQFRLGNTSWRGLRMRFDGDLPSAYRGAALAFLPVVLPVVMGALGGMLHARVGRSSALLGALGGAAMLVGLALWPLGYARLKQYQHGHCMLGSQRTSFTASPRAFYRVLLSAAGLQLLSVAVCALLVWFIWRTGNRQAAVVSTAAVVLLLYLAWFCLLWPYAVMRLQNLVWSHTASRRVRFDSQLAFGPLARLTAKNLLLTALTLGLYRPFAAVAMARLRLQAVQVHVLGPYDDWVADAPRATDDASGDAAGDFLGMDLGL